MKIYMKPEFATFNDKVTRCYLVTEVYLDAYSIIPIIIKSNGISKCHENDKFDDVIGKRIAEARAVKLMYEKLNNQLKQYIKFLEDEQTMVAQLITKNIKTIEVESTHINNLKESTYTKINYL